MTGTCNAGRKVSQLICWSLAVTSGLGYPFNRQRRFCNGIPFNSKTSSYIWRGSFVGIKYSKQEKLPPQNTTRSSPTKNKNISRRRLFCLRILLIYYSWILQMFVNLRNCMYSGSLRTNPQTWKLCYYLKDSWPIPMQIHISNSLSSLLWIKQVFDQPLPWP